MKKVKQNKSIRTIRAFIMAVLIAVPMFIMAQTPPHPNGGGGPGSGNTPVGGGAPLDGGILILISMAVGYGTKKVYNGRKNIME